MTLQYRAAVLHQAHSPLQVETVAAAPIAPPDVLVRVHAAGLCHTDLELTARCAIRCQSCSAMKPQA
jgi:S-(hydroxymethyl)glutathione dehydrogenase / alcohol dehydrogenase